VAGHGSENLVGERSVGRRWRARLRVDAGNGTAPGCAQRYTGRAHGERCVRGREDRWNLGKLLDAGRVLKRLLPDWLNELVRERPGDTVTSRQRWRRRCHAQVECGSGPARYPSPTRGATGGSPRVAG